MVWGFLTLFLIEKINLRGKVYSEDFFFSLQSSHLSVPSSLSQIRHLCARRAHTQTLQKQRGSETSIGIWGWGWGAEGLGKRVRTAGRGQSMCGQLPCPMPQELCGPWFPSCVSCILVALLLQVPLYICWQEDFWESWILRKGRGLQVWVRIAIRAEWSPGSERSMVSLQSLTYRTRPLIRMEKPYGKGWALAGGGHLDRMAVLYQRQ